MKRQITLKNKVIQYLLRKNRLFQNLRLTIRSDGQLVVTAPKKLKLVIIEKILEKKADWLLEKLDQISRNHKKLFLEKENRSNYLTQKKWAQKKILFWVKKLATQNNFHYQKISIRNQKTRWGSCSRKGNLNFNYKIAFLPEKLAEYVIIHELCHLREFNHNLQFWRLVKSFLPDYLERQKELKKRYL